ncbi:MAG: hypothetical protein WDZ91_16925 [Paenibacillaceae bacterium]
MTTNHNLLYTQAQAKLASRSIGRFRLTDLVDNPPANLGRRFRNDVVVNNRYPNVKRVEADGQSVIYEKF